MVLTAGSRAYNDGNRPVAIERFREFLRQWAAHKDAPAARFGLALALSEQPNPNYQEILDTLRPAADNAAFADRPLAQHLMGSAHRALGMKAVADAVAKPNEAPTLKNTATAQFTEAIKWFTAAAASFQAKVPAAALPDNQPLPGDLEWASRARCDQAEMLLRLNRPAEVAPLLDIFLKTPHLARSKYFGLAHYYLGHAAFLGKDYLTAGRLLSKLAPFADSNYGVHAKYLLARIHHLANERNEAAALYEALIADHDQKVAVAKQQLGNAAAMASQPEEKARLEFVTKFPPDYIPRSALYWGVLLYEQDRFPEALEKFTQLPTKYPGTPVLAEAALRQGFCQVQLKQGAEAIKTLTPLQDHPQLGDQARWWMARAQVALADPNNAAAYAQALAAAVTQFKTAADRANQLSAADPLAKSRRHDILIEAGDTQQLAKQYKEANDTYQVVLRETPTPDHAELALARVVTACHLAGMLKESEDAAARFVGTYPQSALLGEVLFRQAGNAFASAEIAFAKPDFPNRVQQLPVLYTESIKRNAALIAKFPEFPQIQQARFALAMSQYRQEKWEDAAKLLTEIPAADRMGELVSVPYVLADCLIRTAPASADDALSAGKLLQQLNESIKLLDAFVAAQPNTPQTPDALLKLGHCHQRVADTMAPGNERNTALQTARAAFEKVSSQFGNSPAVPAAVYERANVIQKQGDSNTAINELNRFQNDPLASSPVAPLAIMRMAALQRAVNKAPEAAAALQAARQRHEGPLANDPVRKAWIPMLQYQHGLALVDAKKLPEAQAVFEASAKQFAGKAEGLEAAWRAGQVKVDLVLVKLLPAKAILARMNATPAETTAATAAVQEGLTALRQQAQYFESQIAPAAQLAAGSEGHLRMIYEAAWCHRHIAESEIEVARAKLRDEGQKKLQEARAKATPAGQPVPTVNPPEVPISAVPLQPSEQAARKHYQAVIAAADKNVLGLVARLELAEFLANRAEHDAALPLLVQALDGEPPTELAERLQLRLGSCLLAKGDPNGAGAAFATVQASTIQRNAADARVGTGETMIARKDFPAAIAQLIVFRDTDPWRQVPEVNELGLLRLAQAQAAANQWDQSRNSYDQFVSRFPQSPWIEEARFGSGWAAQNQNQHDPAVALFTQVTKNTKAEVAARAQLQMGLCRLAQQRWEEAKNMLMVVPYTYDYPQWNAPALVGAAKALVQLKKPAEAKPLLEQVVKEYPTTPHAEEAKKLLAEIKL